MDNDDHGQERVEQAELPLEDDDQLLSDPLDLIVDGESTGRASRLRMFCFFCNRMESHFYTYRKMQRFPFLVGATLGLIYLYGPFTCRCCGHHRRFRYDAIHPKIVWKRLFG